MTRSTAMGTNTAASLRWRARVTKDAVVQHPMWGDADDSRLDIPPDYFYTDTSNDNNDEESFIYSQDTSGYSSKSTHYSEYYYSGDYNGNQDDSYDNKKSKGKKSPSLFGGLQRSRSNHNRSDRSLSGDSCSPSSCCCCCWNCSAGSCSWWLIRLCAVAAALTAASALQRDPSWTVAVHCTLTIFLSALLVYQGERRYALRNMRKHVTQARQTVRRLNVQQEALQRQLDKAQNTWQVLQATADQFELLRNQRQTSSYEIIRLVQRWKAQQLALQQALQNQVEEEVVRVVLESDVDQNFCFSGNEWKRLRVRLGALPGIELVESSGTKSSITNTTTSSMEQIPLEDSDSEHEEEKTNKQNLVLILRKLRAQLQRNYQQETAQSFFHPTSPIHHHNGPPQVTMSGHQRNNNEGGIITIGYGIRFRLNPQKMYQRHQNTSLASLETARVDSPAPVTSVQSTESTTNKQDDASAATEEEISPVVKTPPSSSQEEAAADSDSNEQIDNVQEERGEM